MAFMPPMGEVDTLRLLFEKLEVLLKDTQEYYEAFLDMNNLYKNGGISDKEFFQKLGDYVVAYSALEFLAIKALLEVKKSLGSGSGGQSSNTAENSMGGPPQIISGGSMPSFGQPSVPTMPHPTVPTVTPPTVTPPTVTPPTVTPPHPTAPTATPPTPTEPITEPVNNRCSSCGAQLKQNAKFCTSCGTKIQS